MKFSFSGVAFALLALIGIGQTLPNNGIQKEAAADTAEIFPLAPVAESVPGESERDTGLLAELPDGARQLLQSYARDIETYPAREAARLEQLKRDADSIVKLANPIWVESVYRTRVPNGSGDYGGTAIAVGPGKLHTAEHLRNGVSNARWEVEVDGKWIPAAASPVHGKDLVVLTVSGVTLKPVKVRVPEYGERLTVYGLRTTSFSQGVYVGDHNPALGSGRLALERGGVPVENGDSGGGVFSDDGCLVGTISGRIQHAHLVTSFVPIVDSKASPPVEQAAQDGTQYTALRGGGVQDCPGGVCTTQQQPTGQWVRTRRGGMVWQNFR